MNIPHPAPEIATDQDWLMCLRAERTRMLAACDWTQLPDSPLTADERAAWATYRQALRDAPANWTPGPTWDAPEPPA